MHEVLPEIGLGTELKIEGARQRFQLVFWQNLLL